MTGLEMCTQLLTVFQGSEYEEDKAINAVSYFKQLKFHCNSGYSPETFYQKSMKASSKWRLTMGLE
eukprot:11686471-Ditylum_brightwellii.AAC.1